MTYEPLRPATESIGCVYGPSIAKQLTMMAVGMREIFELVSRLCWGERNRVEGTQKQLYIYIYTVRSHTTSTEN